MIEALEQRTFFAAGIAPSQVVETPNPSTPLAWVAPSQNLQTALDHDLAFAASQLTRTMGDLGNNTSNYVNRTDASGKWKIVSASDWTSGFLPGTFWQMYEATGDTYWSTQAKAWTLPLAGQKTQQGDLAFRLMTTFKPLYEMTGDPAYRQVLLDAAASKNAMWNETVGAFQTTWRASTSGDPRANFGVLMDQTTDMQLLLWAAKETNNQTYIDRVTRHVRNVIAHLVRPDGGTYHWGYFDRDTGDFISGETYQGYANESTWSRGQAWAIYSLTTIARELGLSDVFAAAQKVTDYFIAHLPADSIPYWDFDDPAIPNTYRDSSAAAIAASGMLQLSQLVADPQVTEGYRTAAESILTSLSSPAYLAEGSASHGILLHGAQNVPNDPNKYGNDVSLIFGDYYFLEAINRYRALIAPPPAQLGSLSGFCFNDTDKDGQFDAGEVKTSGKTVFLDGNNNGKFDSGEQSIITDVGGNFSFGGLGAGVYHVRRIFPSGYTYSNTPIDVTLSSGQNVSNLAIGSKSSTTPAPPPPSQTATISGFCFNDTDQDGVYDANEVKTGGKTVFLDTNNNGKLDKGEKSTVTNSSGAFAFTGLAAGTYRVRRVFPSGYMYSTALQDISVAAGESVANIAIGSKPIGG